MVNDVMKSILCAEAEAEELVKNANASARGIVAEAEAEAKAIRLASSKKVKDEKVAVMSEAEVNSQTLYKKAYDETVMQSQTITSTANSNMDEAVNFIIGRIVE